jgi:hypothetical protein
VDPQELEKSPRVGISPELSMDPYGEEDMDLSRDDFEALLEEFGGQMQDAREGEIVRRRSSRSPRLGDPGVRLQE